MNQSHRWTELADVVTALQRRWNTGDWLTAAARSQNWEPVAVPLKGPTRAELAEDFGQAQDWVRRWQTVGARRRLRLEWRAVGGRSLGVNQVPSRIWFDTRPEALQLLDAGPLMERFTAMVAAERQRSPTLVDWMLAHPLTVLSAQTHWDRLVDTVQWIDKFGGPDCYLRQIDVPGVDTKFIEAHRGILGRLLDHQLSPTRIVQTAPHSDLPARFGLRRKPDYVRFRMLGTARNEFSKRELSKGEFSKGEFSEMTVRVDELAQRPLPVSRVFAVENEITYLAFPDVADAAVIFGSGYAVAALTPLRWLSSRRLRYWGDIDTHGFAILNQLRLSFPLARSMLMDRSTLLAHESQWGSEPQPTRTPLELLDPAESDLYQDLIEDSFGRAVRLEQERISFAAIEHALRSDPDRSELAAGSGP